MYCSDGTSLVVSDEVGQIYIFGTGAKMSEKDVKYDQVSYGELFITHDSLCNVHIAVILTNWFQATAVGSWRTQF